jgi:hypothetical protein
MHPAANTPSETLALAPEQTNDRSLLRLSAVCALRGAVVSVAAGVGLGSITTAPSIEPVLQGIAAHPAWLLSNLTCVHGALLWVGAFVALSSSLPRGTAWGWSGWPSPGSSSARRSTPWTLPSNVALWSCEAG